MLDDLKKIHHRDKSDALGVVEKQWQQLKEPLELNGAIEQDDIQNIVYAGMGGSALAALYLQSWPSIPVPFMLVRDYSLPAFVNDKTLVICASYSGNTEETLSALREAEEKGAQIAVITGGGKLLEIAKSKGYPHVVLPKSVQPRYTVLANFKALLTVLLKTGLITNEPLEDVESAAEFLKVPVKGWLADVATKDNPAKQIAQELIGLSVVVYSGPKLFPAAYKWKISVNENAKQVAWLNQYPEFNHNEFLGWSKQPIDKPYAVVDLRSNLENPRIQKRFEVSARLLSGKRPAPIVIEAQGETMLEQLLWTSVFGDFVTIYTGILNNVDPAPVDLVEKFKKELA